MKCGSPSRLAACWVICSVLIQVLDGSLQPTLCTGAQVFSRMRMSSDFHLRGTPRLRAPLRFEVNGNSQQCPPELKSAWDQGCERAGDGVKAGAFSGLCLGLLVLAACGTTFPFPSVVEAVGRCIIAGAAVGGFSGMSARTADNVVQDAAQLAFLSVSSGIGVAVLSLGHAQ